MVKDSVAELEGIGSFHCSIACLRDILRMVFRFALLMAFWPYLFPLLLHYPSRLGAPAIIFGIAETRCGVGVGVRVRLPPAISREDIRLLSSRCHRNVFNPSSSPPSVRTSSVLFTGEGVALPELS